MPRSSSRRAAPAPFAPPLRQHARRLSGSGLAVSLTGRGRRITSSIPAPAWRRREEDEHAETDRFAPLTTAMADRRQRRSPHTFRAQRDVDLVLDSGEASLLDIVDNALNKGVVLSGDLTIALAQVDLVYARLSLLLCAADRVLPNEDADFVERHQHRRERRAAAARRGGRVVPAGRPLTSTRSAARGTSATCRVAAANGFASCVGERLTLSSSSAPAVLAIAVNLRRYDRTMRELRRAFSGDHAGPIWHVDGGGRAGVYAVVPPHGRFGARSPPSAKRAQMTVRVVDRTRRSNRRPRAPVEGRLARLDPDAATGRDYLKARARRRRERVGARFRSACAGVARWVRDERMEHRAGVAAIYHLIPDASVGAISARRAERRPRPRASG